MLVITRYPEQKILVGKDVVITVVEVRGDKVRIGIDAPKGVTVDREEVANKIARIGCDQRKQQERKRNSIEVETLKYLDKDGFLKGH